MRSEKMQGEVSLFLFLLTVMGVLLIKSFEFSIKYLLICLALLHNHFSLFCCCLWHLSRDEGREEMPTSLKVRVFTHTHSHTCTKFHFSEYINHHKSGISFSFQISNWCCTIFSSEAIFEDIKVCKGCENGAWMNQNWKHFQLMLVWKHWRCWFYGLFVFVTLQVIKAST